MDFGDFDGSVFDNRPDSEIAFVFGLDRVELEEDFVIGSDGEFYAYGAVNGDEAVFENLVLEISIAKSRLGTRISSISLTEPSNDICFILRVSEAGDITHITVNGVDMGREFGEWRLSVSTGSILPTTSVTRKDKAPRVQQYGPAPSSQIVRGAIASLVGSQLDKRITPPTLERLINPLFALGSVTKDKLREVAEKSSNRSWAKLLRDISGADRGNRFQRIRALLLVAKLPPLLNAATQQLRGVISSTLYIGPARARSDRYYRYQDLSVSEIDPDGKNFPMFLNSLSASQMQRFSEWVRSLFGYGVEVVKGAGHISINLVYESSSVNIVDTGYGVSQILPVLGQVWWANNRPKPRVWPRNQTRSPIIAIEQPELHLHPAHQALLADAFVSSIGHTTARDRQTRNHFILETHSETMINRLGALIAEGKVDPDDVQILIFDMDERNDHRTDVKIAKFDKHGELLGWPFGFFLPPV